MESDAPELVTIRQFREISEALLAQGCLTANGIESFLADLNVARLEWPLANRGIRLQVHTEDAETAAEILDDAARRPRLVD